MIERTSQMDWMMCLETNHVEESRKVPVDAPTTA